ncbi:unnamed protein product [Closterium sp. NIES-53]
MFLWHEWFGRSAVPKWDRSEAGTDREERQLPHRDPHHRYHCHRDPVIHLVHPHAHHHAHPHAHRHAHPCCCTAELLRLWRGMVLGEKLHVGKLMSIEGRCEALEEVAADDSVCVHHIECRKVPSKGGGDGGKKNGKRALIGNSPGSDFRGVVGKVCDVGVKVLLVLAVAGSGVVINALLVLVTQFLAQVLLEIGAVGADGGLRALRIVDIRCEGGRITRGRGIDARVGGDRSSGSGGGHGLNSTTFLEDNRAKVVATDHNRGEENLDRVSAGVPISRGGWGEGTAAGGAAGPATGAATGPAASAAAGPAAGAAANPAAGAAAGLAAGAAAGPAAGAAADPAAGRMGGGREERKVGEDAADDAAMGRDEEGSPVADPSTGGVDLGAESADLVVRYADLGAQSADLDVRNADLVARSADLDARNADLVARRADLGAQSVDLDAWNADLVALSADLVAWNADPVARSADLVVRSADLDARNADLDAQNADLVTKCADLGAGGVDLGAGGVDLGAGVADLSARRADPGAGRADLGAGRADLGAGRSDLGAGRADLGAGM